MMEQKKIIMIGEVSYFSPKKKDFRKHAKAMADEEKGKMSKILKLK